MTVKELLARLRIAANLDAATLNTTISCIDHNSQKLKPNGIFIAISGFSTDGHLYLEQAQQNGAILAFTEHKLPCPLPQIIVSNTRETLAYLTQEFYHSPASKLKTIGITGTNGKTSTTQLIYFLLQEYTSTGLIGSIDVRYADQVISASITTPDTLQLNHYLHEMVAAQTKTAVIEVSSHGLELHRVTGIDFNITGITNISPDHLDLHHNLANCLTAKERLFTSTNPNGYVFFNADDPYANMVTHKTKAVRISFGQDSTTDLWINQITGTSFDLSFSPHAQNKLQLRCSQARFTLSLLGLHNIYNATLAVGVCLAAGCPLDVIQQRIPLFPGVHRRLQIVYRHSFMIIDDYAHNPEGIKATIAAVSSLKPQRLLIVCAIRGNRGADINLYNGEALAKAIAQVHCPTELIITESRDQVKVKDRVSHSERCAFSEYIYRNDFPVYEEPLLSNALDLALTRANKGDIILLLGAQGMDNAQNLIADSLSVQV